MPLRIFDDRDRELVFVKPPRRVVSLVPSDTLNVFALGAGERLVGRTRYCEEPAGLVDRVPTVGGTKDADVDAVGRLQPDLVIANQEENTKGHLEELIRRGFPVLICFPKTVSQGLNHLARLARVLGVEGSPEVRELLKRGLHAVREADAARAGKRPLRAFVPIWRDPLMTAAEATFLHDALTLAGAQNVFADRERKYPLKADLGKAAPLAAAETAGRDTRYPRVTADEVVQRSPEAILLPDEPHPFSEEDAAYFRGLDTPAGKAGRVVRIGGRDLMWYGARSVEGVGRLRALIDSLR
jgi:ABC-type Fe3+-hydroxamate transport system substrate-binding protein